MQDTSSCGLFYPGTWAVIIIGWVFVDHLNNQRETRKEIRARVDQIQTWIMEIADDATSYHTSDRDLSAERKLKSQIARTTKAISSLNLMIDSSLPYLAFQFRNSISLHNFDTPDHKALSLTDEIIENIAGAAQDLIDALENTYTKKYHLSTADTIKSIFSRVLFRK
ncbi:MAG: hypothetical protein B6D73_14255 [gamma proteobacterium symbiont of Stewartia floridana]|nr:MAG: hypothetical protein B6D73_14255 [gamma proteobacterium symbiont of Stewartia floridana]